MAFINIYSCDWVHLQSALPATECFPLHSLSTRALLCSPLKNGLKAVAAQVPTIPTMIKANGRIHLLGLTGKRIWLWDGAGMNRPVSDPGRIQKAGGAMSGCSTIYQASTSRGGHRRNRWLLDARLKYGGLSTGLEETCAVVVAPWILTPINRSSWFVCLQLSLTPGRWGCPVSVWLKDCGTFLSLCTKSCPTFTPWYEKP